MDKNELPEQAANQKPENKSVDFSDLGPLFSADHPEEKNPSAVDFSDLGPLFDGSQNASDPNVNENPDYTPLFAKEQEDLRNENEASAEEASYNPLFAQAQEDLAEEEAGQAPYNPLFAQEEAEDASTYGDTPEEEAPQAPYTPLFAQEQEEEITQEADEGSRESSEEAGYPTLAEAAGETGNSSVEFSDLGPLFAQTPETAPEEESAPFSPVLPGEAAWLLKKLNDLPRDSYKTAPEAPAETADAQEAEPEEPVPQELPLPEEVFPEEDIPGDDIPGEDIPEEDIPEEDIPEEDIPEEDIPEDDIAQDIISQEEAFPPEAPVEEMQAPEDSQEIPDAPQPQEESAEDPDQVPDDAAAEEEPPAPIVPPKKNPRKGNHPMKKGRPKRKKGEGFFGIPNLLVTAVWIGITILIGVTLGRMIWVCAADVLAFGRDDQPVTITIYEADTIDDVTRKLHEGHLIRYPGLFKLYASLAVDDDEIQPGIWDLNTRYDYHALVSMMSPSSSRDVVEVMIPEGYSCRQIFALLEEKKICTATDLSSYAANGELDQYWFLEGVPRGEANCLEGFLFPDTYQFYKNDSPRSVLQKMLTNFETRFDETMQAQIGTLNDHLASLMRKGGHGEDYIASHRFGIRDVINVASLIEKETSSAEEGYTIASVIYNRLFNWGDNIPYLNIDATIIYALGGKTTLTQEDLKVDSPYNTYTNTGLTPGPIANPGLSSIRAALEPAESDYYYYVLDPAQGSHRFSTTYDEHKANIASIGG